MSVTVLLNADGRRSAIPRNGDCVSLWKARCAPNGGLGTPVQRSGLGPLMKSLIELGRDERTGNLAGIGEHRAGRNEYGRPLQVPSAKPFWPLVHRIPEWDGRRDTTEEARRRGGPHPKGRNSVEDPVRSAGLLHAEAGLAGSAGHSAAGAPHSNWVTLECASM